MPSEEWRRRPAARRFRAMDPTRLRPSEGFGGQVSGEDCHCRPAVEAREPPIRPRRSKAILRIIHALRLPPALESGRIRFPVFLVENSNMKGRPACFNKPGIMAYYVHIRQDKYVICIIIPAGCSAPISIASRRCQPNSDCPASSTHCRERNPPGRR
jgi:hypothetical protein